MNKYLSSLHTSVNATYFDQHDMSIQESMFIANNIDIEEIFSVTTYESRRNMKGYMGLSRRIAKDGMTQPIIVIENTDKNFSDAIRQVKSEYINRDSREGSNWLALTGNSRLAFAEDYLYDSISCYIVPNLYYMHAVQLIQQNGVIKHEV